MNSKLKLAIVIILAVLVAFPILAYMGINSPLPFATWGATIYSSVSKISLGGIPGVDLGLIGGVGGLAGATSGLAYIYNKTKGTLKQTQSALTTSTQKVESLTSSFASEKASLQETSKTTLDKITAEKQAAIDQAKQLQNEALNTKAELAKQQLILEEKRNQIAANFKANLPTDSTFIDPLTGNKLVKVVEKVVV
jgi:hypothetical protein